jgi:hypothetical protein
VRSDKMECVCVRERESVLDNIIRLKTGSAGLKERGFHVCVLVCATSLRAALFFALIILFVNAPIKQ